MPEPTTKDWVTAGLLAEVGTDEEIADALAQARAEGPGWEDLQALIAERGERIAELEGRLATALPIARAAVQHEEVAERLMVAINEQGIVALHGSPLYHELARAKDRLSATVDALTPEQKAEILKTIAGTVVEDQEATP